MDFRDDLFWADVRTGSEFIAGVFCLPLAFLGMFLKWLTREAK